MKKVGDYYPLVVEDTNFDGGRIIATGTLIVEQKFIHSCATVMHTVPISCMVVCRFRHFMPNILSCRGGELRKL